MESERLQYFITVAEEGSISAAARKLHMSQPPLSLQIQNLEEEYGVRLFNRSSRGIHLTEAGKILYDYALRIASLETEAREDLRDFRSGLRGKLRLGVVSSGTCPTFLEPLKKYLHTYPGISFSVEDGNTFQMLDDIRRQRIDFAVVRTPFAQRGLDVITLNNDHFIACGTHEYMKQFQDGVITLKDLENKPLIIYRRWEQTIHDIFAQKNISMDAICVNDDARTSLQWAEAGIGIALIPSSVFSLSHHLEAVNIDEKKLNSSICLIRNKTKQRNENEKRFWEIFSDIKG
ncbi:MAG: LysR family transcriptional regulator [Erysipelotrichaceae bacterium]|nr:LysR family transcriptional regulator [Erysipelotrichaceae bacterium]